MEKISAIFTTKCNTIYYKGLVTTILVIISKQQTIVLAYNINCYIICNKSKSNCFYITFELYVLYFSYLWFVITIRQTTMKHLKIMTRLKL
jgi:hypothetical protein